MTGGAIVDREELRLGVVMSGGVSLAIWMGGATTEIEALRRSWPASDNAPTDRHQEVYGQLLELTATTVRIDVISGTSAGGLNGALLAAAIAYGSSLDPLRGLWMKCGSFNRLFRKPTRKDPPSILMGDEYLLEKLAETLDRLRTSGTRPEPGEDADDPPVPSLFMTTALVDGEPLQFHDEFGSELLERTHLGLFHFEAADFADPKATRRLALAARCSSAHPGGFEASLAPIEDGLDSGSPSQLELHPAMGSVAQWRHTQFTLDGGLLLNKPVEPALDAIFAQPAGAEDIRRLLLLVVPEAAAGPENGTDGGAPSAPSLDNRPTIFRTLSRTNSIPRQQSLAGALVDVRNNHIRVRRERLLREWILRSRSHLATDHEPALFQAYRRLEIDQQVAERLGWLERPPYCPILSSTADSRDDLEAAFAKLLDDRLPRRLPDTPGNWRRWKWGRPAAEQLTVTVLDLLRSGLRLAPPAGPPRVTGVALEGDLVSVEEEHAAACATLGDQRAGLLVQRKEASRVLATMRQLQGWQAEWWREQATLDDAAPTQEWVDETERLWRPELRRLGRVAGMALSADPDAHPEEQLLSQLVVEVVEVMRTALPMLWALAGQVEALAGRRDELVSLKTALAEAAETAGDGSPGARLWIPTKKDGEDASALRARLSGLVGAEPTETNPTVPDRERWLELLVRLLIEQAPLLASDRVNEQALGLVQLSAEAKGLLDPRKSPPEKLTGLQLAHFGAFYKESWRANDWMWGRHDAALHLVRILLAPRRLQKLGLSRTEAFDVIQRIALGRPYRRQDGGAWLGEDEADQDWLSRHDPQYARKASEELKFLDQAVDRVPRSLPHCTAWVARRLQLSIAASELPNVADAMERDEKEGSRRSARSGDFLDEYKRRKAKDDGRLDAATASELLHQCHVSDDRLQDEMGSDLFTRTATTGAAVAMAAVHGTRSGLGPLRGISGPLRAALLSVWLAAHSALDTHKVLFALLAFVTGIAGAALSIDLVSAFDLAAPWRILIATLLFALGVVAVLRSGAAAWLMACVAALVVIGAVVALAFDLEVTWGFVLLGGVLLVLIAALVPPRGGWWSLVPGAIALAGIVAYLVWPVRLSGTGEGCSASPGEAMLTWAGDIGRDPSDAKNPCDEGIREWGRSNVLLFASLAAGGVVAAGIRAKKKTKKPTARDGERVKAQPRKKMKAQPEAPPDDRKTPARSGSSRV